MKRTMINDLAGKLVEASQGDRVTIAILNGAKFGKLSLIHI